MLNLPSGYRVYLREEYRHEHEMRLFRNFAHTLDDEQGTGQLIVFHCANVSLEHPQLAELTVTPDPEARKYPARIWLPYSFILLITTDERTPVSFAPT